MKRSLIFLVSLLFALFFVGCQEDAFVDSVDPATPTYTLKISSHGDGGEVSPSGNVQVAKGDNLAIYVNKQIGVDASATMDGTELPLVKGKTGYFFRIIDVKANAIVNIEFEKTNKWLLTQHSWDIVSRDVRRVRDGKYFYTVYAPGYTPVDTLGYIPGTGLENLKLTFAEDSVKGYDVSGKMIWDMNYSLDPETNYLVVGGGIKGYIIKLDDTNFWWATESKYYNSYPDKPVPEEDRVVIERYIAK